MNNNEITIQICNMNYTVKIVNEDDEHLKLDGYYRGGIANRREEVIYLSNDLNDEMIKRVLLHEIAHVYIYGSGMAQVEWQEENVADFIEAHLLEIYETYKKLVSELLGEKE